MTTNRDYAGTPYALRPRAYPLDDRPACPSTWGPYLCTLARGHDGKHVADGISTRCAEWGDSE